MEEERDAEREQHQAVEGKLKEKINALEVGNDSLQADLTTARIAKRESTAIARLERLQELRLHDAIIDDSLLVALRDCHGLTRVRMSRLHVRAGEKAWARTKEEWIPLVADLVSRAIPCYIERASWCSTFAREITPEICQELEETDGGPCPAH